MSIIVIEGVINLDTKMLVGWVLALAAINWGLVGLVNVNIVETVFGSSVVTKVVYVLIGLAGVYKLYVMTMGKK